MSLPNITFVKGNGGLGRPLAGQDHFSGLIFYSGAFPSGFSSSNRIKNFLSVPMVIPLTSRLMNQVALL
jgi:hypothetical protein